MAISGYEEKDLRTCARELCHLLEIAENLDNINSLKKKFGKSKFCEVAKIKLEKKDRKNN